MNTTEAHDQHIMSVRANLMVFGILLGLMALTVLMALIDLGPLGVPVAMAIATAKAVLILLYFMHVKFSNPLVWLFSAAAFVWLFVLVSITLCDYLSRDWLTILGK